MTAFFFDLDGTLIDSRADLAAAVNHTRRDLKLAELPENEVLAHVGLGAGYLLKHAIPECESEGLRELFLRNYAAHMLDRVELYPGVAETLRELHSRGCPLGINTAKPAFATRAILEKFGLAGLFGRAVIAGGDCAEFKPSPLPLLQCAALTARGRLEPGDWMVGDNWTDLGCAQNAGVRGAFCEWGFGSRRDEPCAASLKNFAELLDLV